jgi:glycine/D-amino acid oxidase-like deaminating enzyme
MKKIAIAGAGFAGLSTAWHLLQYPFVSVTLFDPKGIGGGASGVSTGLLHPFPGKLSRKSWQADVGMKSTAALISQVEEGWGRKVADRTGVLRLARTGQQQHDFRKVLDDSCSWWPVEKVLEFLPQAAPVPALWIPEGITVYSKLYLEGLWLECCKKGATHKMEPFHSPEQFDQVVYATGFETLNIPFLAQAVHQFKLKSSRGQSLLCRWSESTPCSLLSEGHLSPTEDPDLCQLGSTYEPIDSPFDVGKALALKEKIALFYPPARHFEVVETRVGTRIARDRGYRPVVMKIDPKNWVFSGLGSRGLLYHAWLGEALAEALMKDYDHLCPYDLYKSLFVLNP